MRRRVTTWTAVLSGVTLVLGLPALAVSGVPAGATSSPLATNNPQSAGIAGYYLAPPPASASARDTFMVPTLTCTSTSTGVAFGSFIIVTTVGEGPIAEVLAECQGGVAVYSGAVEVNATTTITSFTPRARDTMRASVAESPTGATATLRDVTQATSKSVSTTTGATNSIVEDGTYWDHSGATLLPVPNFGKVKISGATIDGVTPNAAGAFAVDRVDDGNRVQIHTGLLNAAGKSWTEVFKLSL